MLAAIFKILNTLVLHKNFPSASQSHLPTILIVEHRGGWGGGSSKFFFWTCLTSLYLVNLGRSKMVDEIILPIPVFTLLVSAE